MDPIFFFFFFFKKCKQQYWDKLNEVKKNMGARWRSEQ